MPGTTEFLQVIALAVDRAATGIAILRPDGTVAYANASAKRLLGCEGADLSGTSVVDLEPGLTVAGWQARWERLRTAEVLNGERVAELSGSEVVLQTTAMRVHAPSGDYCVTTLHDVTALRGAPCPACGGPRVVAPPGH
jgi:PAS domain S-box-containing protein